MQVRHDGVVELSDKDGRALHHVTEMLEEIMDQYLIKDIPCPFDFFHSIGRLGHLYERSAYEGRR